MTITRDRKIIHVHAVAALRFKHRPSMIIWLHKKMNCIQRASWWLLGWDYIGELDFVPLAQKEIVYGLRDMQKQRAVTIEKL
jgi:hypothetical protein